MKILYLVACIIGLTGCQKNISDEALKKAQDNLAYDGAEQYLKKYDQKGSRDKVYENFCGWKRQIGYYSLAFQADLYLIAQVES